MRNDKHQSLQERNKQNQNCMNMFVNTIETLYIIYVKMKMTNIKPFKKQISKTQIACQEMKLNRMKLLELKKSQMNFSQIRNAPGKGNMNRHGNGNDIVEKMMKLSETLLSEMEKKKQT